MPKYVLGSKRYLSLRKEDLRVEFERLFFTIERAMAGLEGTALAQIEYFLLVL